MIARKSKFQVPEHEALDAARAAADEARLAVKAASDEWQSRVTAMLDGVGPEDVKDAADLAVLAELAWGNRAAHDLGKAWVTSLGSENVRAEGVLVLDDKCVAPAARLWTPHISSVGAEDALEDMAVAVQRYVDFIRDAVGAEDVVFDIMDNDLSQSGIPTLDVRADGTAEVRVSSWGVRRTEFGPSTLRAAIEWLARHRWYGDPSRDSYHD